MDKMYEELKTRHDGLSNDASLHASADSFTSNISPAVLKKDLENELKLDSSDIRSYAWFHGSLPRDISTSMVEDDGDFLIRESLSSPGEFVLTVKWNNSVLHFKINQSVKSSGGMSSKVQFMFEREGFDSIPALIMYHYGKSIPISVNTGAIIKCPVNRKIPLSYSNVKYASLKRNSQSSFKGSQIHPGNERSTPSPSASAQGGNSVPPKPSRVPSFRKPVIRHLGSRSKPFPVLSLPENGAEVDMDETAQSLEKKSLSKHDGTRVSQGAEARSSNPQHMCASAQPDLNQHAFFQVEDFRSLLLQPGNKPVEKEAMIEIKKLLLRTDPFKLARHMTYVDGQVCRIPNGDLKDIFLQKGAALRKNLLERHQCLAFWVAVCIVHGSTETDERADLLNVFIQVANELVHSLGNVYGFSSLMLGLTCPQLSSLTDMWSYLQQKHTNNAVTMEKKLRPLIQLLDEGRGQINPSSSCIPHIVPIIRLYENPSPEIYPLQGGESPPHILSDESTKPENADGARMTTLRDDWWRHLPHQSFDSLLAQLRASRIMLTSLGSLRMNAEAKLHDFEPSPELIEIFSTEFHLRLLWGHKGFSTPQLERFEKFDKVITLMAKRLGM